MYWKKFFGWKTGACGDKAFDFPMFEPTAPAEARLGTNEVAAMDIALCSFLPFPLS